ncbi:MAG: hypothetical protein ISN29_08335, partial [Gammaproteobacteria bacterium AqS3]|nr:hypothetical protein [Gammaproteobacteria bacterium AqS3]
TEGGSQTFTVQLASQPVNARRVLLTVTGNNDVTVAQSVLNFTTSNWNMSQTVTVRAAHDADQDDDTATISLSGDRITSDSVDVTVDDDDDAETRLVLSALDDLAEGGSQTFTVKLAAQPGNPRKVALTVTGDNDVTVSPTELDFTTANWNSAQTVTVSAEQDDDQADDTATISLTGSGITTGSVAVTVDDDDDPDVGLALSDLDDLTEGGSKTFTVALAAQPGNPRKVMLAVSGDDDVTVNPDELVFTTTSWDTAQTVTVRAGHDDDKNDDTASISLTGHSITAGSVAVAVEDDDDADVGLTLSDLETLAEGGSKTFTVQLATQPGNARSVTLELTGDNDVMITPTELNFSTTSWNSPQTITVSAEQDTDQADDTATISLTGDGITASSVTVTVDDDEDADVGLTLSDLDELTEGGSKTFTVALAALPGNPRKVMLAVTGDDDVTVNPDELVFTTSNWNTAQTVTVSAADDADQADDTATISLTGHSITAGSVSVSVADDDDAAVALTLTALEPLAEGGSKTFTVALAAQPGNARKVTLAVDGDADVTVAPEELNFTTANWNTAQTVTVSAGQDADQADDTATVSLTGDGVTTDSVSVTVDDDDDADVALTLSDLDDLAEGGSKTFTVALAAQPGNARKVTLAVSGDDDVTITPEELDFTTSDWNSAQTVTVSAADDADQIDDTATVSLTGDGITAGSVSVTVDDDDDAAVGLELSDLETLAEGGSKTFTVALAAQPANARRVELAVSGDADVTVAPEVLDFTTTDWSTAQTVTVSAADDTDKTDDAATVSLTGDGITAGSVSVSVDDDDDSSVGLTLTDLDTLTEGGSKSFTVKLTSQPGNARSVALAVTGDSDVTVSPASLNFTATNWSAAQTVTVSADQDTDQADDTATVNLTGDGITSASVSVAVDDDDDADVGLALSDLDELTEGGSKTFTVALATQPVNARKVTLTVSGDADVTVSPTELDFTTANWSTAQTVTVSAGQDTDQADDTATINLTGGRITAGSVSVSVDDDDDADVGLALSDLDPLAEGGSQTFTVALAAQPGNARKVALTVTGDADVTVTPNELAFTTADWSTAQTVTVSAEQDADKADDTATISLTGDGITAGSVSVTADDDDDTDVGLTLSDLDELDEGGSETFTVQLAVQPGNARKVALAVAGDSDVTVAPQELDFTTANWSTAQTVTVSAADDADQTDDTATVNLTGDGITAGSVSVAVDDDDDADVALALSDLENLAEGGSKTFTVNLAAQPGNPRKVALAVSGDAHVTVSPTELNFTTSNWNITQTVTVSAEDDTDQADDIATVSLTGDGITAGSVSVTVDDDDDSDVGLTLS